jgi:hypothetical protein
VSFLYWTSGIPENRVRNPFRTALNPSNLRPHGSHLAAFEHAVITEEGLDQVEILRIKGNPSALSATSIPNHLLHSKAGSATAQLEGGNFGRRSPAWGAIIAGRMTFVVAFPVTLGRDSKVCLGLKAGGKMAKKTQMLVHSAIDTS